MMYNGRVCPSLVSNDIGWAQSSRTASWQKIFANPDNLWDWKIISNRPDLNASHIIEHPYLPWDKTSQHPAIQQVLKESSLQSEEFMELVNTENSEEEISPFGDLFISDSKTDKNEILPPLKTTSKPK